MAIIDWPTTRPFAGALFSLGLDVSESANTGFLTGNRTRRSNLVDRLRGILTVPPAKDKDGGAQREAFMLGWRSSGDTLRMGMPHRPALSGTLRGSPVLSASAAAGTRSISISGALSGANLLTNSGFEIDTDADGMSDGWTVYYSPLPGSLAVARPAGNGSAKGQSVAGNMASGAVMGISRAHPVVTAGVAYSLSCDAIATSAAPLFELAIGWYTAGASLISTSVASAAAPTSWGSRALSAVAPATATNAILYLYLRDSGGGIGVTMTVDNAQFEAASVATAYAGLPTLLGGDFLSIGGNLVQVAYNDAVMSDAGAGTIPLTLPLQKALAPGAAVTWNAPTGLWELDDDGLQLDYSAPALQSGFAIPLRQVIA